MPNQILKRGALPTPPSVREVATRYRAIAGAPASFLRKPAKLSMWGNDVHNDCVTAEEAFAKACYLPEIFISDAEVIAWATQHGVLEGAFIQPVMDLMKADGFDGGVFDEIMYCDGANSSVDYSAAAALQSAIWEGPVKAGVGGDQIEAAWRTTGGKSGWFATGFQIDQNIDHCVSLCGYGSISWLAQQLGVQVPPQIDGSLPGYAMFTWGSIGIIDVASMTAVTHEAWVRLPTTVIRPRVPAHAAPSWPESPQPRLCDVVEPPTISPQ